MIHPNRTYLLQLKRKQASVSGSLKILKARRQALLAEFLLATRPFLRSRQQIRELYHDALRELYLGMGDEGRQAISSAAGVNRRPGSITVVEKNLLGVRYHDVLMPENIRRPVDGRNYDITASGPHLEEAADRFEQTVESLLVLAGFEIKLYKLGEEILRVSRRARVLEERVLPGLASGIKATEQCIGEREREEYFRLKKFKNFQEARRNTG